MKAREMSEYVGWLRQSSPYINTHRGRTFVVAFDGAAVASPRLPELVHDLALLSGLGIQLVLVPGVRPQVEQRLAERSAKLRYMNGLRITDAAALACVKEAAGTVRVELEALLSMGVAYSPMAGYRIRVASGNFVTARPGGARDRVDYEHTGEVRRIDAQAIRERLTAGCMVLVSPLGSSPTGEIFNLYAEDVALAVARALKADKLLFLLEENSLADDDGKLIRELTVSEARQYLHDKEELSEDLRRIVTGAIDVCRAGVPRVHLVPRDIDGGLLLELFTRDGVG